MATSTRIAIAACVGLGALALPLVASAATPTVPADGLDNGSWTMSALEGQDALAAATGVDWHLSYGSYVGPQTVTLRIGSDRSITGNGGCNVLFGQAYQDTEHRVGFRGVGTSRRHCPADIAAVENRVVAALNEAVTVEVRGGRLSLIDAQGDRTVFVH